MNDIISKFCSNYENGYYDILGVQEININEYNINNWQLHIIPKYGKLKNVKCILKINFTNFPENPPNFYPDGGYYWTIEFYKKYHKILKDYCYNFTSKNFKNFLKMNFFNNFDLFLFVIISHLEEITNLRLNTVNNKLHTRTLSVKTV